MQNFVQYAPTEVIFGKGTENETGAAVKKWGGSRVLLVYGGGSAVRSGLLGRVEVYGVGIGGRRSDIESGNKIVKPFPTESEPASRAVLDAAKS